MMQNLAKTLVFMIVMLTAAVCFAKLPVQCPRADQAFSLFKNQPEGTVRNFMGQTTFMLKSNKPFQSSRFLNVLNTRKQTMDKMSPFVKAVYAGRFLICAYGDWILTSRNQFGPTCSLNNNPPGVFAQCHEPSPSACQIICDQTTVKRARFNKRQLIENKFSH